MKILKILSSENLKKNLKSVWERFPVSLVIILLISSIFFILLHFENKFSGIGEKLFIANLSLIMTFVFSVSTYLSSENSEQNKLKRNLFQFIPIGFGVIFYNIFSIDPNDFENFLFFFLSFAGIISFLYFAPYIKNDFSVTALLKGSGIKKVKQSVFYTYFYNISVVILISFIFAGVLFGLGAIAITATDALFDLNIRERLTYGNWTILSLSIISPIFTLTQIPDKKSFLNNHFNENAFFSFLIKFVAIPFIYLYFFILYAYTIKVLSNFSEWPKGEVSWLVIGFSIFGYLAYSFSYIFEEKNKLIKSFRKVFPYAVIPQVFMLFYAIYLRINQYDITVNRYFVVVFGLWLLVVSLYFIFSKKKNLIIIPSVLTLFVIFISIIPGLNVYTFPESRQLKRLEINLHKANILQNSNISPLKNYSDIDKELSKNIYSGIDYLCDFNSCKSIKNLFPKIYGEILKEDKAEWEKNRKEEIERLEKQQEFDKFYTKEDSIKRIKELKKEKYTEPGKWTIVSKITEKIKVRNSYYNSQEEQKYFEYTKDYNQDFFPMEIKSYTKIYRIQNYDNWTKQGKDKKDYAEFDSNKNEIIIKKDGKEIEKINISKISTKLFNKYGKENNSKLNKEDLTFVIEQNGKTYKLLFEHISVLNPDYKEEEKIKGDNERKVHLSAVLGYSNGFILVK